MTEREKGRLITLEGGEGAGKSVQAKRLEEHHAFARPGDWPPVSVRRACMRSRRSSVSHGPPRALASARDGRRRGREDRLPPIPATFAHGLRDRAGSSARRWPAYMHKSRSLDIAALALDPPQSPSANPYACTARKPIIVNDEPLLVHRRNAATVLPPARQIRIADIAPGLSLARRNNVDPLPRMIAKANLPLRPEGILTHGSQIPHGAPGEPLADHDFT